MSFILGRYLYRKYKNRNNPQQAKPSDDQKQSKQIPLCEHQLAHTNEASGDAVLDEKAPNTGHQQIPDEKRGAKHCPQCIAEKKQARAYRWKLILSLLIPNCMASMDATITATALPTIASHFSRCSIPILKAF
jgi:hypothetical protein